MKVKLLHSLSEAKGRSFKPGDIYEADNATCKRLIDAGLAKSVRGGKTEKAELPE